MEIQAKEYAKKKQNNFESLVKEKLTKWTDFISKNYWNIGSSTEDNVAKLWISPPLEPNWRNWDIFNIRDKNKSEILNDFENFCHKDQSKIFYYIFVLTYFISDFKDIGTYLTKSPFQISKLPTKLPLFTNYRNIEISYLMKLIINFSGIVDIQKMDIKALAVTEGE